jgi:hypothetical protein
MLAEERQVRLTHNALQELARLGLGLDEDDACAIIAGLGSSDFIQRIISEHTGEWMYVFKPVTDGMSLYVKLAIRGECIVISFHEDEVTDEP